MSRGTHGWHGHKPSTPITFEYADPEQLDYDLLVSAEEASHAASFREGYMVGEAERIALATANSELRSIILKASQVLYDAGTTPIIETQAWWTSDAAD